VSAYITPRLSIGDLRNPYQLVNIHMLLTKMNYSIPPQDRITKAPRSPQEATITPCGYSPTYPIFRQLLSDPSQTTLLCWGVGHMYTTPMNYPCLLLLITLLGVAFKSSRVIHYGPMHHFPLTWTKFTGLSLTLSL